MSIEVSQRRSVFAELKAHGVHSGDHDYMEVTEWSNGEGFDVVIDGNRGLEKLSISYEEWDFLQVLINYKGE